jgi:hypothetical protein
LQKSHQKCQKWYIGDNRYIARSFTYWLSPITSFHHIGHPRYYRDILESVPFHSTTKGDLCDLFCSPPDPRPRLVLSCKENCISNLEVVVGKSTLSTMNVIESTYKFDVLWPISRQPLKTLGCGFLRMKELGGSFIISK